MILIFIVDENFAIGYQNDMVHHISRDQKRFKEVTTGNIIVCGRKTLETFPGGRPLPNRDNIVMSHRDLPPQEGMTLVHNREELMRAIRELNPDGKKKVFLAGGGQLVKALWDLADEADISMIHHAFDKADVWIPNLREDPEWVLTDESEPMTDGDYTFTYQKYKRITPDK